MTSCPTHFLNILWSIKTLPADTQQVFSLELNGKFWNSLSGEDGDLKGIPYGGYL
jgi:hypothetical protein